MKKIILLALSATLLTACAMTPEKARSFTDDQLCTQIGVATENGNTANVTTLLNELKTRAKVDQSRCQVLQNTGAKR